MDCHPPPRGVSPDTEVCQGGGARYLKRCDAIVGGQGRPALRGEGDHHRLAAAAEPLDKLIGALLLKHHCLGRSNAPAAQNYKAPLGGWRTRDERQGSVKGTPSVASSQPDMQTGALSLD
jgi:hypothetical protein